MKQCGAVRLFVLIMSHTHFRVNLHSVVDGMSMRSLLKTSTISKDQINAWEIDSTTTYFVNEHSTI